MRFIIPILFVLFLVSAADAHGRSQSSRSRFRSQQNNHHQPSQAEIEAFRAGVRAAQQQNNHHRQQFNGHSHNQFRGSVRAPFFRFGF
jgi:hypothetical protein